MAQAFAIPNDPKQVQVNQAIKALVIIRSKVERDLGSITVKTQSLKNDPAYEEAHKKEDFKRTYLKYLNAQILNLELTT